jgi:molybdopterin synthase catalytic subunit/molybdopterin converting factor small subunit
MRVTLRSFASLRELSADHLEVELADQATVADAWVALQQRFPRVEPYREFTRSARNGRYAAWEEPIANGDVVAFLPPVSGGASRLTDGEIDVAALEASLARTDRGAVVTFVGRARDVADDGRRVVELEYEVYPEMAEAVLEEIVAEAGQRGAAVAVVHRFGVVPIGAAAVAIVTAAPHRAEAYEANRNVIEAIKERLPIWKRERFADGSEWKRPGA